MTKITTLILFFVFSVNSVKGQDKIQIGIKSGINISYFTGQTLNNYELTSRTSFHIGLLGEYFLGARWNLQPELLYSEQGFSSVNNDHEEIEVNLNYLQIPVLVEYQFINNLFVQSGPQLSYLLKEDYNSVSRRLNYNRFDFSLGLGLEYEIDRFFLNVRYGLGLNRIFKNSGERNQNRVFQAGLGWVFN